MQKNSKAKAGTSDANMSAPAQGASKSGTASMNMTVGSKPPAEQSGATDDSKKSAATKDGGAGAGAGAPKDGLSKLKDPTQAHETLDLQKNEKAP